MARRQLCPFRNSVNFMTSQWEQLLFYTSIPAILMAIGGIIALIKQPSSKVTSGVQHFAAGVVFAAVAVELLPKVVDQSNLLMTIGFATGVAVMLLSGWVADKLGEKSSAGRKLPFELIVAVGIDVFIDGILIGVSFLASIRSGIMIAAALALEVLFLGLSTTATMAKKQVNRSLGITIIILLALLIPIGATLGFEVVSHLSRSAHLLILAFGVAALLYLVTEELLTEAHEVTETTPATIAFFLGFLIILLFA